ncbi:hypothetical protein B566_EDAN013357 [Ephemera danica]|nr:hypothetical protein B566_EDAN013357 [Ephemera danica]
MSETGIQKQLAKGVPVDPETSIQGLLELCLKKFKPLNEPKVVISSRTDQGVHALKTTVHVDLEKPNESIYHPQWLMHGLNSTFEKLNADIRIQKIQIVPEEFHARFSAKSRTYLYRFAVRRKDSDLTLDSGLGFSSPIPMSEWRRCYFVQKPEFDASLLPEVTRLFVGIHDFRTFMGRPNQQPKDKDTVKEILQLEITPGSPLLPVNIELLSQHYEYWNVICKGRSFLYRQVRRIVGVLIAVGLGKLQVTDVQRMIDEPSPSSWSNGAAVTPAYGLYLLDVEYDPVDLVVQDAVCNGEDEAKIETSADKSHP